MVKYEDCRELLIKIDDFIKTYNIKLLDTEIVNFEKQLGDPTIWDNPQLVGEINKKLSGLKNKKHRFEKILQNQDNLKAAIEMGEEREKELIYKELSTDLSFIQNQEYLSGKFDDQDVHFSLHSGAGGVDAQDWSAMLCSMYQTFATNQGWVWEVISLSSGEEGGIKSVTLSIKGENVYGYLKEEAGVHRLVRISPFNSGKTRETSFALVEVLPANLKHFVDIKDLPEKELKWEYSMSSGKGGQSVNTTYSAVRLVHLPTNISVTCQNERSQLQNKQQALKYLINKLAVVEIRKNKDLKNEIKGTFVSAEWGSQIRSYVLHPYKMVKDHRSGFETNDVENILEQGNILPIIWSVKTTLRD